LARQYRYLSTVPAMRTWNPRSLYTFLNSTSGLTHWYAYLED
jgi:hypothetical protein